jgi:hypothetical protein
VAHQSIALVQFSNIADDYTAEIQCIHMADTVTLESLDKKIDKAVDDLSDIIQSFVQHVDERFNKVEVELSNVKQATTNFLIRLIIF